MASKAVSKAKAVMADINKALGSDAIKLGSDAAYVVTYIPTGILPIDALLQGGVPRGRMMMIIGDWSTLKTYIALCAIRETQQLGGVAALIDTERSFDPLWAKSIGINVDELLIYPPRDLEDNITISGEMAIDAAEAMVRNGVDLMVFDSVAAALPEAERKKRMHDENIQPGRLAALMSAAGRRLTAANNNTAIIWVNQLRENIGVMFGPNEKQTGGRALPYYSSYIMQIKKTGKLTRDIKYYTGDKWQAGKEQIGQQFKAELLKSKLNKPFRDVWFNWSLTESMIDEVGFVMNQGIESGYVKQSGSNYSLNGLKANGKDKFRLLVETDPSIRHALENAVRAHNGLPLLPPPKSPKKVGTAPSKPLKAAKKTLRKK